MGLKASISEFSVISHSFQPSSVLPVHTKNKIKSPTPQSHRPHSSTPFPHFSSDQTIHFILSSFSLPIGVGNNNSYYFKSSNQTKSLTFPSLALIRSAPRLHSFKLFTSLSLFLSLYPLALATTTATPSKVQIKPRV